MGIGTAVKNILGNDRADEDQRRMSQTQSRSNEASSLESRSRLPAGTGPGTLGKSSDPALEQEIERAERNRASQGIAGHGTDAAAAAGGSLEGTHMAQRVSTRESGTKAGYTGTGTGLTSESGAGSLGRESGVRDTGTYEQGQAMPLTTTGIGGDTGKMETRGDVGGPGASRFTTLEDSHAFGHNVMESMPDTQAKEDTKQLQPVVHERIRHVETEEVARVKEHERHNLVHHVQHHTQPLIASEELPVQHRNVTHPVTRITETHASQPKDKNFFEQVAHQFHDTLEHVPKERLVIDKGTVVNEHIHHHVHHVIQPLIRKETIDRQHIHTTIPIHEITHEAPVVHQSKMHQPRPLEHFVHTGGAISGIPHDKIDEEMLRHGKCERRVEGIAEQLERELNLGQSAVHPHGFAGTTDELPAKKEMAGPADRAGMDTTETPMVAPSKN